MYLFLFSVIIFHLPYIFTIAPSKMKHCVPNVTIALTFFVLSTDTSYTKNTLGYIGFLMLNIVLFKLDKR